MQLDKKNGNTLCTDVIIKDINNIKVEFNTFSDGETVPPVKHKVRCDMVFDINMDDSRRKIPFVAGEHMTETPTTITYASFVSCGTVMIAPMIDALNDLDIKMEYIDDAHVIEAWREKVLTVLVPKFGGDEGKFVVIVILLYVLKISVT